MRGLTICNSAVCWDTYGFVRSNRREAMDVRQYQGYLHSESTKLPYVPT